MSAQQTFPVWIKETHCPGNDDTTDPDKACFQLESALTEMRSNPGEEISKLGRFKHYSVCPIPEGQIWH